ncbi:hypothetical protein B2J93_5980 [Marssonina coronariae]|uniref:Uncharacterized protein n=1 Tax=Diplocarpon coronariae TaxID=2795749 RepID=A0A218Z8D0_9HELO|nr:hypothetical protein JHW43_008984 [Diplocarpon mali]OWP04347.1 hypothetical protein B2J93_5980 [Marssonina coronariae]
MLLRGYARGSKWSGKPSPTTMPMCEETPSDTTGARQDEELTSELGRYPALSSVVQYHPASSSIVSIVQHRPALSPSAWDERLGYSNQVATAFGVGDEMARGRTWPEILILANALGV